jgi:hypothetical protein
MSSEQYTFLFVPDISGFTQFVNSVEILHSRHIISELLDIIIRQDELGLTVSEIEGDAVLFYKKETPPVSAIIHQAQKTFVTFHTHLRRYESDRVCRCGACRTASGLSLKFIAHSGSIGMIDVAGHKKLHGADNILVHKLMKNTTSNNEYLLLTSGFTGKEFQQNTQPEFNWVKLETGKTFYDNYGEVAYKYIALEPLRKLVQDAPAPNLPFNSAKSIIKRKIDAPVDTIYFNLTYLDMRVKWNPKIKKITNHNATLDTTGTTHTCLIDNSNLEFKALGRKEISDEIVYGESIESYYLLKDISRVFILRGHNEHTHIELRINYKFKWSLFKFLSPLFKWMFQIQSGMELQYLKSFSEKN